MTKKQSRNRKLENVTIVDVAREAGVSAQTVSRVVNNKDYVSSETRQRVLDTIAEMGFTPHTPAQRLRSGNTQTIAVLYPLDFPDREPINQLQLDFTIGAAAAAGNENYFCNLLTNPLTEDTLLGMYRSSQVDGVIVMEIHEEDWRVELLREHDYPFVMIGRCRDTDDLSYVELDMETAMVQSFEHLVQLGHSKIGLLTFANNLRQRGYGPAVQIWRGYERALKLYGLEPTFRELHFTTESMFSATNSLLEEQPDLSAIVSATDAPTGSVINALTQSGYSVPDEFSVVGLATDRMAEIITPPLTAIQFPAYEMGFDAATILIKKLKGEIVDAQQRLLPPNLIVRGSTAPLQPKDKN